MNSLLRRGVTAFSCLSVLLFLSAVALYAGEKQWSGAGGGASAWEDAGNWFPAEVPDAGDDVFIDAEAGVSVSDTFSAKSLTIGGRADPQFFIGNFIYGTFAPEENTDNALYIRKGGVVNLADFAGALVLKGSLKLSDESLPDEPAFMFLAE
ncbi:MAG: hypothetical protein PHC33_03645 [Candidatus Omnitrophica bacterium]|nr:hypothetical protein [Candidatus Omnitrophota bacterium]